MGRVFEAEDLEFGRTVAVKELLPTLGRFARARFAREALVTGNLEHPGIPAVYARGTEDGLPFYAMRRVRGRTLREALEAAAGLEQRLKLLPALITTANTLAYAHRRGVVHRDVKPDNILLGEHGETVLLDWGLAGIRGFGSEATDAAALPENNAHTVAGTIMGTPQYMAPEQARGEEVDARADVFALGVILHELLCGRPAYEAADTAALIRLAARGVPTSRPPDDAPPGLLRVRDRAMAAAPQDRYPDAAALVVDLETMVTRAIYQPGTVDKVVTGLTAAVTGFFLIAVGLALVLLVPIADMGHMGPMLFVLSFCSISLLVVDWRSRGTHKLHLVAIGLAAATLTLGVVITVMGVHEMGSVLLEYADDEASFRRIAVIGLREALPSSALGALLASVQLLLAAMCWRVGALSAPQRHTD